MAGSFNLTFTMGGGTRAEPPPVGPALRPVDLFPTRIWQARLDPLIPNLPAWVKEVLAMRAACSGALNEMGLGSRPFELQSWINLHDRI